MTFEIPGWSGWHRKVRSCAVQAGLTAATVCTLARAGGAQALAPGARVRVLVLAEAQTPAHYISGRFVRLKADTVVISPGNGVAVPIPLNAERQLQVLVSSHGHGGTGAALGALLGGLTGGISAAASWQPCKPPPVLFGGLACLFHPSRGGEAAGGAIVGAGGGALLGLAIGSLIRREAWTSVRKEGVSIVLTPVGAGIKVTL